MSTRNKRSAPRFGVYRPTTADSFHLPGGERTRAGSELSFCSWNIHFGAGPTADDARRFPLGQITANLDRIVETVREREVQLLAVQEVDRDSHRSANLDQLDYLREHTGLRHVAFATTWDASWVPHPVTAPPSQQYGRMWSGQAILSEFPIVHQRRHALPQPARQGWLYNRFYIHRCVQEVVLDLGEQRQLRVFNVHLEAFDKANRRQHGRILARLLKGGSGLCLGDFNALPPDATKLTAFADEPEMDFQGDDTLSQIERAGWIRHGGGGPTFPASGPSRRLDHLFASEDMRVQGGEALIQESPPSDHLPLFGTLEI